VNKTATSAHDSQSAFCFMLTHVQLQLPAARTQKEQLKLKILKK